MKTHKLKTAPKYFEASWRRVKPFEIRKNDRDFMVGDKIVLMEYVEQEDRYTGDRIYAYITYMTDFEQKVGYCVLGLQLVRATVG